MQLILPSPPGRARIEQQESAFFFSAAGGAILRKHGLIHREVDEGGQACAGLDASPLIAARLTRLASVPNDRIAVFEGPLDEQAAKSLGIRTTTRQTERLRLLDIDGGDLGELCYATFTTKRIPRDRSEKTEPVSHLDKDPRWNSRAVRYQSLAGEAPWRPWAIARPDDGSSREIVGLTDGRRLVLGVPWLDVAAAACAVPALEHGFYFHERVPRTFELERRVIRELESLATSAGVPLERQEPWPRGAASAFTVRHDYDRLISDAALSDLLNFYDRLGIRSSWGFLISQLNANHARRIISRGHEVNLHSVARNEAEFVAELDALRTATGSPIAGATAHGGIGAAGCLGQTHYDWCMRHGLHYSEMLGRTAGLPHQALIARQDGVHAADLILPPSHLSLDVNTKPEGHRLSEMMREVPARLRDGQHVVLMNHPDVHQRELRTILESQDWRGVWRCTFAETAARRRREWSGQVAEADPAKESVLEGVR